MKQPTNRIPALALALLVVLLSTPVLAGGRDVPDQKKSASDTESSSSATDSSGLTSCAGDTLTTTTIGGIEFEVRSTPEGDRLGMPVLFGQLSRWVTRLIGNDTSASCPSP
jgi:hypothetical protein